MRRPPNDLDGSRPCAHDGLAHAHHALRQHEQAEAHWQHALDLLTSLGSHDTDDEETNVVSIREHLGQTS